MKIQYYYYLVLREKHFSEINLLPKGDMKLELQFLAANTLIIFWWI